MKRRVIKQGNNTLTLTLPRKWTEKSGVKAGDELDVDENEGNLAISTKKNLGPKKIRINLDDLSPLINRTLIRLYQQGYDELELNYSNPEFMQKIRQIVILECIGFEIVQHGDKSCVIKDISGTLNLDFNVMFRRLFLILKGMLEDGLIGLKNNELPALENMTYRDYEVNKFSHVCLRYLNKRPYGKDTITLHTIVYILELIGDDLKLFFKDIIDFKIKPDKEIINFYEKLIDFFTRVYEFTFAVDKQKAVSIANQFTKLNKGLPEFSKSSQRLAMKLQLILHKLIYIQGLRLGEWEESISG